MTAPAAHNNFIDVILPLALPQLFTYSVPPALISDIEIGKRVEVPFGKTKRYAAIIRRQHQRQPTAYQVKPIYTVLDDVPIIQERHLQFWEWLSEYYMAPIGDVMNAALPSGLKLASETIIFLNPQFQEAHPNRKLSSKEALTLQLLRERQSLSVAKLRNFLEQQSIYPLLQSLMEDNIISIKEKIKSTYQPKTSQYVKLHPDYRSPDQKEALHKQLKHAPKQLALLMAYQELSSKQESIPKKELIERADCSESPFKSLVEKKVFNVEEKEVDRVHSASAPTAEDFELTKVQQSAYNSLKAQLQQKLTVLLYGVTSSGKTHLYIRLIEDQLHRQNQVLYLLPEIALTTQIISRLRRHFGDKVGVYHSRFTARERMEVWQKIKNEDYQIVIGPRSALFLPLQALGLVIVDEEHDNSYKQFDPAPRYNARDSAIYLAQLFNARVVLGTATPSIESYFNATITEKYGYVELKERYGGIQLPEIELADWRRVPRKNRVSDQFTPTLLEAIKTSLNEQQQIILFQNRRGYVPYLECKMCGWAPYCRNCDVTLTHHKYADELRCHYCGYMKKVPSTCPACGSGKIEVQGFGTEKIEESLQHHFPDATVRRMDLDTTQRKHGHHDIIRDFEEGQIDILVGTQMVTKGLDFDHVGIVGILSAESLLNHPDFRANERAFQLMAQVSGRAGRKKQQGKVIIQTYDPEHPIIQYVYHHNYEKFYENELAQRKAFRYPPYYRMIKITLKHKKQHKVESTAQELAHLLKGHYPDNVLGPEYGKIPRLRQYYIKNLLLKFNIYKISVVNVKKNLSRLLEKFAAKKKHRPVRIQMNVDPQD